MTVSVHSMVRLTIFLAVGSTILAVGVSRLDPPRQIRRSLQPVTTMNVNDSALRKPDRHPRWLDLETGDLTTISINAHDVFEAASCSPWVDESGKRQVVGRWSSRSVEGPLMVSQAFGLGRYSYPDGELLNQVDSEIVPIGPPCWFPGTQARVLFSAGDGQLYRFAFEPMETTDYDMLNQDEPVDHQPTALTWGCPKPGRGDVFISDISWSTLR